VGSQIGWLGKPVTTGGTLKEQKKIESVKKIEDVEKTGERREWTSMISDLKE
jgi:hypothetical protein